MNLTDFDYDIPNELIAKYPTAERSQSRLLVVDRQTGQLAHQHFYDIGEFLQAGDLLVLNDTKVFPARLYGQKTTGGRIEVLIERILDDKHVLVHLRASKAPRVGSSFILEECLKATMIARREDLFVLELHTDQPILEVLHFIARIPLPPYFEREDELIDRERYQTVYANEEGSVAAPTAGLHFDEALLEKLQAQGVNTARVTLHVGAGTFQPVRCENITEHVMHEEYINVSEAICEQVQQTKQQGGRVIAVGTTSVRCLETAARSGKIQPYQGDTNLFIYPGYQFNCVDGIITNFHLPQSSLLMLVSAFAGHEQMMAAYATAVTEKYRFFSYGDAMLII